MKVSSFFIILISLGTLIACGPQDPEPPVDVQEDTQAPPSTEATTQFFHAWMADVVNDLSSDDFEKPAKKWLTDTATKRINWALRDTAISNVTGKDSLVWGPALFLTEESGSPNPYTVENMMYCTQLKGTNHYSIGIAGTNEVSYDDWLKEDFNVNWSAESITGGKISKGSRLGLENLESLKDRDSKKTLLEFLGSVLADKSDARVSVAGHSLGGALTQVYSNYLRANLNASIQVDAWVYAGPTAGDATFADGLVSKLGADNYHAYNNRLDVIPHVWQEDSVKKICTIYRNKKFCDKNLLGEPIINMVTQYLIDISTATSDRYKIPGNPQTFEVDIVNSPAACEKVAKDLEEAWDHGLEGATDPFVGKCGIDKAGQKVHTFAMAYFLAEVGEQHTTAYTDYFFPNPAMKAAVSEYANPHISGSQFLSNVDEELIILTAFLAEVAGSFNSSNPPKCACE